MLEKRPAAAPQSFPDASSLRIGIVHARWNEECIDALVKGSISSLEKAGVKAENIIVESVPGSFELPIATSRYVVDICFPLFKRTITYALLLQTNFSIADSSFFSW